MNRIRIATIAVAIAAVGAFLMGCGGGTKTTWEAGSTGGAGGGAVEGTSVLAAAKTPDQSGVPGVMASTESTGVALTFDDGPDPNYTPKVLDMLRKHNV